MPEFFVDTKGEFGLEAWAELMGRFPKFADRAIASGLKYEGGRLMWLIKQAIRGGGPPGRPWAPLSLHTLPILAARRRKSRWARQERKTGKGPRASTVKKYRGHTEMDPGGKKPLLKLAAATRYQYNDSIKTVTIGPYVMQPAQREKAEMHAAGFTKTVDRPMGKLLAAYGFPVRTGTVLKTPARPVVGPIFEQEKANIYRNIELNVVNNIYRYLTGRPKDWDKQPEVCTL